VAPVRRTRKKARFSRSWFSLPEGRSRGPLPFDMDDFYGAVLRRLLHAALFGIRHLTDGRIAAGSKPLHDLAEAVLGVFLEHVGAAVPAQGAAGALLSVDSNLHLSLAS
jgi:hypothetical protein